MKIRIKATNQIAHVANEDEWMYCCRIPANEEWPCARYQWVAKRDVVLLPEPARQRTEEKKNPA